ncbi:MAG: ABC transporter permease [Cereibacter sphaeroides]|uniref:ABC transporter permease n=1 Tax=Cereibacter sphaeroides TaxID=1063 RepID=A0A2W5SDJ3_CERSP|nr:MAG: ABC transporter permease [Cereibacter sphaeroides]
MLSGAIVLSGIEAVLHKMQALPEGKKVTVDLAQTTQMDTAGAWLVETTLRRTGGEVVNATEAQTALLETVRNALPAERHDRPKRRTSHVLEDLGRLTVTGFQGLYVILGFFGQIVATLIYTILHPSRLRLTSLVFHIQQAGLGAVPIVSLMSFLIGIVLAYQGADQLRQFGAEVFVVDLIAVSVLRELGILLTAIIVAGRSASAYTAAIGSMQMSEEVDAMRTLGLDPIELLVLPRVLALVIFLPVLGFIADMMGLLGGALMSWFELGISPGAFQTRLLDTDVSNYLVGLVKAPFFAVIIGVIGCYQGLQVEGNAESLGARTSRSVVQAIFMVIVADATFSIFFAAVGV